MLTGSEIRRKFLRFFEQKQHRIVHSSSLVPHNDPTLLFTNAGMNQFKDVFLGLEKRDYNKRDFFAKMRARRRQAQRSGKCRLHQPTPHVLRDAGELLLRRLFQEGRDRIRVGTDYVAGMVRDCERQALRDHLQRRTLACRATPKPTTCGSAQGVPKNRIFEMGLKDNFWQMGDTGPCGPCSEIHYDMGPAASEQGHTDCRFPCDCGRYVEIWNLVFMQFDRDASGKLNPLPKPSIDTGMGLERVTAVLQGVISNYETDLFVPLIERAADVTGVSLESELRKEAHAKAAASLRVIADHSRAATFLISDGVLPANDGRGYVLRKIIRRAIRHGRFWDTSRHFFSSWPQSRESNEGGLPGACRITRIENCGDHSIVKRSVLPTP